MPQAGHSKIPFAFFFNVPAKVTVTRELAHHRGHSGHGGTDAFLMHLSRHSCTRPTCSILIIIRATPSQFGALGKIGLWHKCVCAHLNSRSKGLISFYLCFFGFLLGVLCCSVGLGQIESITKHCSQYHWQ